MSTSATSEHVNRVSAAFERVARENAEVFAGLAVYDTATSAGKNCVCCGMPAKHYVTDSLTYAQSWQDAGWFCDLHIASELRKQANLARRNQPDPMCQACKTLHGKDAPATHPQPLQDFSEPGADFEWLCEDCWRAAHYFSRFCDCDD